MSNVLEQEVANRQQGQFQVSIGTSLAVEAACGVYPENPVSPAPLTQVKEVWFNLRTLFRNLVGAVPTEVKNQLGPDHLVPALIEELAILESVIIKASNGDARAVFYYCDYSSLPRKFPRATFKQVKTEKQQFAALLEQRCMSAVFDHSPAQDLRSYRYEITGQHPASFIVTHLPVDLLSRYAFSKLWLLESHTGAIKPPPQWSSKLTDGKHLTRIPFNEFTLQVFGDNGHMFSPQSPAVRKAVLEVAERDRWTALTTVAKIRESLKNWPGHPADRAALLSLL